MQKIYLSLNSIDAYHISLTISCFVWQEVLHWDYFARDTIGKQFVRSTDSISANIAEGFGRYHKKDKIHFYRYASGSVQESLDWLLKSRRRLLISNEKYEQLLVELKQLLPLINQLIQYTNRKLKQ